VRLDRQVDGLPARVAAAHARLKRIYGRPPSCPELARFLGKRPSGIPIICRRLGLTTRTEVMLTSRKRKRRG
jgi:hypothetical protein